MSHNLDNERGVMSLEKKFNNPKAAGEALDLMYFHSTYKGFYKNRGLVGIGPERIHVSPSKFLEIFKEYKIESKESETYPGQLTATYRDVEFIALLTESLYRDLK